MALHRLIVRLDYAEASFEVIDAAGRILRAMQEASGEDALELKESFKGRMAWAECVTDRLYYQVSMSPLQAGFGIEVVEGIDVMTGRNLGRVERLFRLLFDLFSNFNITRFSRIGVRGFFITSTRVALSLEDFSKKIESRLIESVSSGMGGVSDFLVGFDGESDDHTKYSIKFGPFGFADKEKSFPKIHKSMEDLTGDLIMDVDQWTEDSTLNVNPAKWAIPRLVRASDWFSRIANDFEVTSYVK